MVKKRMTRTMTDDFNDGKKSSLSKTRIKNTHSLKVREGSVLMCNNTACFCCF